MNNYLIPANTKKSQLIFNLFRPIDLWILAGGSICTLFLVFIMRGDSIIELVIKLLPLCFSALLVMPIPYYHNVLVFLREVYIYMTSQKVYLWRGWCATYGFDDNKKN